MSVEDEIGRVFERPLARALKTPNDGKPLAQHTPAVAALQNGAFDRVFCRQTHAQTCERIDSLMEKIKNPPNVTGGASAQTLIAPPNSTDAANVEQKKKTQPVKSSKSVSKAGRTKVTKQKFWQEMSNGLLSTEEREKVLDDTLNDDERAELAEGDACFSDEIDDEDELNSLFDSDLDNSDDESGSDSDDDSNDESDGGTADEMTARPNQMVDEVEQEVEYDGDNDHHDDDDDDDDDSVSGVADGKQAANKNTKKRKKQNKNKSIALSDDEDGFLGRPLSSATNKKQKTSNSAARAASSNSGRKMSKDAREVKKAQAERKRNRKEQFGDNESGAQLQEAFNNVIQVAAVSLLQERAALQHNQTIQQPFWRLVLADESGDEEIGAMAQALSVVELELDLALEDAERGNPVKMRVLRDFVSNASSVRRLADSMVGDTSTCTVMRRRVERSALAAYEAVRVRADGTEKPVKLIALASLEPLVEALWFADNFMTATQQCVAHRLTKIRGYKNGTSKVATALAKLRNDTAKNSATSWLCKTLRKSLDRIDMSVAMLHIDPPAPADADAVDED